MHLEGCVGCGGAFPEEDYKVLTSMPKAEMDLLHEHLIPHSLYENEIVMIYPLFCQCRYPLKYGSSGASSSHKQKPTRNWE